MSIKDKLQEQLQEARKITTKAIDSFMNKTKFKSGNDTVEVNDGEAVLKLHGSEIAKLDKDGKLHITNAGYASMTTKDRLNGIPGVSINQKAGTWYLNGTQWDGEWTIVESDTLKLSDYIKEGSSLREIKVWFNDGSSLETNMSPNLSDKEMTDYYKIGKTFNIGSGEDDKMVKVTKVKILK